LGEKAQQAVEQVISNKPNNMHIVMVGLGQSELLNVPKNATENLMVNGQSILSRRDTKWLKKLANNNNVQYKPVIDAESLTLKALLNLPKTKLTKTDLDKVIWTEWFFVPLLLGVFLLLFSLKREQLNKLNHILVGSFIALFIANNQAEAGWFFAPSNYKTAFDKGTQCYQQKDYLCAIQAFSESAWVAPDKKSRGPAVFNLGNSYFKIGGYEQAAILFKDAENWGVDKQATKINHAFADSLAKSVKKQIADIKETKRRADWKASSRLVNEDENSNLSEGLYLPDLPEAPADFI
jgi:tetratricopeptide (TPR) repeat protein